MNQREITNGSINYSVGEEDWEINGFWLRHRCDEWKIGNLEDAKKFLADLEKTIKEVETINLTKGVI